MRSQTALERVVGLWPWMFRVLLHPLARPSPRDSVDWMTAQIVPGFFSYSSVVCLSANDRECSAVDHMRSRQFRFSMALDPAVIHGSSPFWLVPRICFLATFEVSLYYWISALVVSSLSSGSGHQGKIICRNLQVTSQGRSARSG